MSSTKAAPGRCPGQQLDGDAGLNYFGPRYYAARFGRFSTIDPVGGNAADPQSWNRYVYARNAPGTFVDPTGTSPIFYCEARNRFDQLLSARSCSSLYGGILPARLALHGTPYEVAGVPSPASRYGPVVAANSTALRRAASCPEGG
ncbi:MAG: RHS repeat-associated core domain-containing protein [Vicinamibacterales bacterium]